MVVAILRVMLVVEVIRIDDGDGDDADGDGDDGDVVDDGDDYDHLGEDYGGDGDVA